MLKIRTFDNKKSEIVLSDVMQSVMNSRSHISELHLEKLNLSQTVSQMASLVQTLIHKPWFGRNVLTVRVSLPAFE